MLRNKTKIKSFTLVELLVAISISLLLVSSAYLFFNNSYYQNPVKSDIALFSTFFSRAKNYASNPENEKAKGYVLKKVADQKLDIYRRIVTVSGAEQDLPLNQSVTLTNSKISDFDAIFFATPSGISSLAGPQQIIFTSVRNSDFKEEITINKPGVIN